MKPHWTTEIPLKALKDHTNCETSFLKEPNLISATRKSGEPISIYTIAGGDIDHSEIFELGKRKDIDLIVCIKRDTVIPGSIIDHLASKRISIGTMKDLMSMVAQSNNWPFVPKELQFILKALAQHKVVSELRRLDNRKILIKRRNMKDVIMIHTPDYEVTSKSVRDAMEWAPDAMVIVASHPFRKITGEAYTSAGFAEVDLFSWPDFLGKLNSKWN